jgi:SAM-dependent methyltransferase
MDFVCDFVADKKMRQYVKDLIQEGLYHKIDGCVVSREFPERELSASSYDEYFKNNLRYGNTQHKYIKPLFSLACKHANSFNSILEVGAGFGHGIERIVNKFHPSRYVAYEFSLRAANQLRAIGARLNCQFEVRQETFQNVDCSGFDCVIGCEVLEHINWDRAFLSSLPSGCFVMFSVPIAHAFNHVRAFLLPDSIWYRYHDLLDILEIQTVYSKKNVRPKWWVGCARRKGRKNGDT